MSLTTKSILIFYIVIIFSGLLHAQTDTLLYRSEYEKVGDQIAAFKAPAGSTFKINAGNSKGFYAINSSTGILTINKQIPDTFDIVHTDLLTIIAGTKTYKVKIVDGYDYFIQSLNSNYKVLNNKNVTYIDNSSEWTAYNNLWGIGTAVPNVDFRIATICKNSLPDTTYFVWDVPDLASAYGGSSVWGYVNVLWGNRTGMRTDLGDFPFKIADKSSINLDFDFQNLFGNNQYKIAMNMFMTNESYLTAFSNNAGDFFLVFDQIDNYLPPYPYSLPDSTISGKPFAFLYDNTKNNNTYENRRVIVKNGQQFMKGNLELKNIFNRFSRAGYLNQNQSVPNIQLGIEITSGFGAVAFNKYKFTSKSNTTNLINSNTFQFNTCYPNPVKDILTIEGNLSNISVYNSIGQKINLVTKCITNNKTVLDFTGLSSGFYFVKTNSSVHKIYKQ